MRVVMMQLADMKIILKLFVLNFAMTRWAVTWNSEVGSRDLSPGLGHPSV
jgi:hypothetical protein